MTELRIVPPPILSVKEWLKSLVSPNQVANYLYALRKAEYYTNARSLLSSLLGFYWRRKLRNRGIKLGYSISLNTCAPGLSLPHYGNIVINHNAHIGRNCRIHVGVNIGASGGHSEAPQIGDNVYIGPGAILFGNITIGSNNTIGANATVNKSFPQENVVLAGTPAKIVKENEPNWLEFNHRKRKHSTE